MALFYNSSNYIIEPMPINKKELKALNQLIRKEKEAVKNDQQYDDSLKTVEKILKKKRGSK
jgi:hypothetical protein